MALPQYLAERTHPLNTLAPRADGEFVLYWMHHAVRAHENAALDVARQLALTLDQPLLVYQGLGGNHRFNADRHHAFILQGAVAVARELDELGIRYAFHLPQQSSTRSPLHDLIPRAGAVVMEDFPAPPFPRWSARWAQLARCQVLSVDANLIVPMRLKAKAFDRAFAFRDALKAEFDSRILQTWPLIRKRPARFEGALGFAELDLAGFDLAAAIAACEIDHGIAPVAETIGGSAAGYARWDAFKVADGLAQYADLRNDAAVAPPLGVSRLSPYLHHGHVSALRLAREANAQGSRGGDKFLDELFVWRELSYNFCLHSRDPEHFKALPSWAQETLLAHAKDRREVVALGDLARAKSPSKLWNLLQQSLLRHGELHNNVRMTWGKAIPHWQPTPQAALRTLIDLNHRYALDGNNPNSYGGLLWCLGLFDSPHLPPQKVLGSVRARPMHVHSKRLDHVAYAAHIARPAVGSSPKVAIIGAGIAGLAAARTLADHGIDVTVYDKGHAPGGRVSSKTRGFPTGDHGAAYFTARDPRFLRAIQPLIERGEIAPWKARWAQLDATGSTPLTGPPRFVGTPTMAALASALAVDLKVRCDVEVAARSGTTLHSSNGEALGAYDWTLITTPPAQALKFIESSAALRALAENHSMQPCWTALISTADTVDFGFDAAFVTGFGLRLMVCERSKKGRVGSTIVVHADVEFSQQHLKSDGDAVAALMVRALDAALAGRLGAVSSARAHCWRYAQAPSPLGVGSALDTEQKLGLAGDWLSDGRIEGAWLSGVALAGRLLTQLALHPA